MSNTTQAQSTDGEPAAVFWREELENILLEDYCVQGGALGDLMQQNKPA